MASNLSNRLSEKGVQLCEGLGRLFQARGQRLPEGYRLGVGVPGAARGHGMAQVRETGRGGSLPTSRGLQARRRG